MWNLTPWKKGTENRSLAVREPRGLAPLDAFRREFDQLWNSFWTDFNAGSSPWSAMSMAACGGELTDHEKEYRFRTELPGFEPEELDVRVSGNLLTVRAEHRVEEGEGNSSQYHYGSYQQSFSLPHGVDAGRIEAQYRNGVLEISLPKTEAALGKRIEIRSA